MRRTPFHARRARRPPLEGRRPERARVPAAQRVRGAALVLLLAGGCASAPDAPAPFPTASGPLFEVTCHYACGPAALQALTAAQHAAERVRTLLGPAERAPLRIHLNDAADFTAVAARRSEGRFAGNLGFTAPGEGAAWVGVEGGDTVLAAPALRRVMHEAAHLAAASAAAPGLPAWLAEGLATRVEREVAAVSTPLPSRYHDPWLALHAWRALRLLDAGELPGVPLILDDTLALGAADSYAVHSVFFEFLRERRWETLDALLAWAAAGRPSARPVSGEHAADLDRAFRAWVLALADSVPWTGTLPSDR